jgi:glutamate formiminotransferase/formiminotetrahydrofolate cyclodeaminase
MCKGVKAIGWYIPEYGLAQVSMNITNVKLTALHEAFDASVQSAATRGLRVTGSELVGLVPLRVMLDAGRHYLKKQEGSQGVSDDELIHIAIKSMGLDELSSFDSRKKIIEYVLEDVEQKKLAALTLSGFSEELAMDSPAPGGGSAAAYAGALAASLGAMVGNLSANKRGWEERQSYFSDWAVKAQEGRKELLRLVDEDTQAFNAIMEAFKLPKETDEEKKFRQEAVERATLRAIESPLRTMQVSCDLFAMLDAMVREGNPNSVSDAGVGAVLALAAVEGGWMNVMINLGGFRNKEQAATFKKEADEILTKARAEKEKIVQVVMENIL